MNESQQTVLLDAPREVDVVAIERELMRLWKRASDDVGEDGSSSPVVRACSMNLVVVTDTEAAAAEIGDLVGDVTLDHPSRIFLITADRRSGTPVLDAWISARCSLPVPGGKQVCCEQINLTARGTEANKIPSIVTSLLVSDVPTVLLWKHRVDLHDAVLRSLIQVADRLLIDSSEDSAPGTSLVAWGQLLESHGAAAFGDLAWTHLSQWRALLAQVFQPLEGRKHLPFLESVQIGYSTSTTPRHSGLSQSLLLVGWLARSLRWIQMHPLQDTGNLTAKFRLDEQAITVTLSAVPPRANLPGGIGSIALHGSDGFNVIHEMTERNDCIRIRQSGSVGTVLPHTHKTEAELVSLALDDLHRDQMYEGSLATLVKLLR
ncbi:MAG TPA: glucose-6-phosphate dehydrogenase assembly protein OpcA [Bacteroidota bacterium]|nr:glucose-6-phosphate dehydrogenase assembly protein OpcA [Bacteroidota bacterium]